MTKDGQIAAEHWCSLATGDTATAGVRLAEVAALAILRRPLLKGGTYVQFQWK